jgi:co-chaperonin GroES (HSP10)
MNEQTATPRLLRGLQAEYDRAEYPGGNFSGCRPTGKNILVLMDQCASASSGAAGAALLAEEGLAPKNGTASIGALLPPEMIVQMNLASESGVICAMGAEAFSYYDDGTKWTDYKYQPGDRVFTERYSGKHFMGRDGRMYRLMSYSCVGGLEEPIEAEKPAPASNKRKAKG